MLTLASWLIAGMVALPMVVLAAECLAGSWAPRCRVTPREPPPFTVLVPAHDEAACIAATIRAIRPQLRPRDRLVVIADNCADDTAAIAEREGAEVLRRDDPMRRGKGYALEYARLMLADGAGQVVVIVDADCRPAPHALTILADTAARHHAVVQGCYLLEPPADASPKVRVSCFAFAIKNLVRQLGLRRLGGAAILQGSGMAFPASIFRRARWGTESLVEDLDLGLRLLGSGDAVVFEPSARFTSDASSDRGTISQRTRWEHGILDTAMRFVPRLLAASFRGRPALLMVALDLLVPPTVLLLLIAGFATLVVLALSGAAWPFLLLMLGWVVLTIGLVSAWLAHGRTLLPANALGAVVRYMIWKLPLLAQFVTHRERRWIRTERER